MYDSSKERPPHLAKVLRRDRSSSESKRSDKPVRREEYPATHSRAEESTRQSVNELIDRTRNYSSGRNMDAKGASPSSQRDEIMRTKHGRLTHDRERSRASSKSRSSTRSPRRSRHSHHSIHQSSDREKSDRKSSKPRSSKDSKPNKSKEEKKKKKEEPTKPKAADVLEVDWPSLSPEKEITEPEPDSILNRFTPCNVLLDMGVSPSLLPAHLLEKVKTLCNENNQHANKKLVTTHELGALNRNESLRHSSWQAAFKARFPRLTSYEDAKFRRLALNRTQDPIPSTLPPAVINAKSYAASIKHYISKTKPIEVQ
uniref:Uncharacterized protein n=1 Tax=Ciona savignyi TaxID=51511 RepID=H2YKA0_CIOSA